jgi:hypothetical protein
LGFVPSGTFYASAILNEPLVFLGFIPYRMFYASAILNDGAGGASMNSICPWLSFVSPLVLLALLHIIV